MRCIGKGCASDALDGSNYCGRCHPLMEFRQEQIDGINREWWFRLYFEGGLLLLLAALLVFLIFH